MEITKIGTYRVLTGQCHMIQYIVVMIIEKTQYIVLGDDGR